MQEILSALPLGILLSFTIGPVFFVLLETSITKGFRMAIIFDLGVVISDIVFITIAYVGIHSFKEIIKANQLYFLVSGGILLFIFGMYSYIKQIKTKHEQINVFEKEIRDIRTNYWGYFFKGFLLNFINIGVLLFWFGILITFIPRFDLDNIRLLRFLISVILIYFSIDCVKILIAKRLGNFLTPSHIYNIRKLISIIIIVFSLILIVQSFFKEVKL